MKKVTAFLMAGIMTLAMAFGATGAFAEESAEETAMIDAATPITVSGGQITGTTSEDGTVTIYKGVPYAAAPVGELRWKAPAPVESWEGVRACDTFSNICPQSDVAYGDFQPEFYSDPYPEMSEDCLYLNVWTPAKTANEKLPVMVYIHGGGNGSGWSYEKEFDGEAIAAKGCILVTINYRLGVFGFLAHEDLAAEADGCSGNYGLMDQAAAFEWVRDNIAAFGGDPENVTMFGQSAGAMDMTALVCTEKMNGLVDHAIFQSGGFLDIMPTTPAEEAQASGKELTDALGKSIAELREMSDMDLYNAVAESGLSVGGLCVDGNLITESMDTVINEGRYLDIDYMIGSNSDEFGGMFASGVELLGNLQIENGRRPAYCYLFTHFIPGIDNPESTCYGAFHTGECWYIFETLDRCWRQPLFTDADYQLADLMSSYWTNFAKTGDPNGESVPEWAPYTEDNKNIQVLDVVEAIPTAQESVFVAPLRPENARPMMVAFATMTGEEGRTSCDLAHMLEEEEAPLNEEESTALAEALDGFNTGLGYGYVTEPGTVALDVEALALEDGTQIVSVLKQGQKPAFIAAEVKDGACVFDVEEPSVCFVFTK